MYGMQGQSYTYEFSKGTNYFQGKNSSGKTEFYSFIDFMFGSSEKIINRPWYINSLVKATMLFAYNENYFYITRTRNINQNYLYYADENEDDIEPIDLREYKDKLNSIFAQNIPFLKDIRTFTNEELTYRAFTMFNFLGEKGQGRIQDFLDKCRLIKYSVKLNPILNFIFNKNIEKIYELKKELDNLIDEVKELESNTQKYNFIINQVNKNLRKVDGKVWYTGENASTIKIYF